LYTFYLEVVLEELKNAHKSQLSLKLQEELLVYKANTIYDERSKRAQIILNKYEVLTREYQNQNKLLKENHERIIASEKAKR
jgi:endo-beta-N-acetylglucosaminidase D